MMTFKKIQWIPQTLMTVALAAGISACSDDHFDISSDVKGKLSLWQNIQGNENLSQFADILQGVYTSKDEKSVYNETYAQMLDGDQNFTVWAPVNGSFDYNYYKNLLKTGIRDSIFKVEKELVRNNMTRYTHAVTGKVKEKIDLYNDKTAWMNGQAMTMQGVTILTPNIGAKNGLLHVMEAPIAYRPNLYEYMATRPDLDSLNQFVKSFETAEFNEYASTQGPTVNGYITWVDSITRMRNSFCEGVLNAYINREDSNYAMIMPTNEAWNDIKAKVEKYFVYKQTYSQKVYFINDEGKFSNNTISKEFSEELLDSMVNTNIKYAITKNLAFNANWQYEQQPIDNMENLAKADSLQSTYGLKFKKTGTLNKTNFRNTVEVDDYPVMFGGKEPEGCSNGYAYVTDSWNLPTTTFAPILDYTSMECLETLDGNCNDPQDPQSITLRYEWDDSTYTYRALDIKYKNNTSNPSAYFKLMDVLSCKYDIYLVVNYNMSENRPNKFKVSIDYDNDVNGKRKEKQDLRNPNEDAVDVEGESLYGSSNFVNRVACDANGTPLDTDDPDAVLVPPFEYTDTICIAKDFEFPVCYYGMENFYPTLCIASTLVSKERKNRTYSNEILLNTIILRPKGHDGINKEEDE